MLTRRQQQQEEAEAAAGASAAGRGQDGVPITDTKPQQTIPASEERPSSASTTSKALQSANAAPFLGFKALLLGALVLALAASGPFLLARFSANNNQRAAHQQQPQPVPAFEPSGGGQIDDNPFERRKQQQQQRSSPGQQQGQRPEPINPLYNLLKQKQGREKQALTTAHRPRVTAEALRKDPALALPTRIPVGARLLGGSDSDDMELELELCEVDMAAVHRDPAQYPTMAEVAARFCADADALVTVRASQLAEDATAGPQLEPAGFIFHQTPSSSISASIGGVLASVPTNLVYSSPAFLLELLGQAEVRGLPEPTRVRLLRSAVLGMGRSRHHEDLFLELPPALAPHHMALFLRAFPDAPWAFVYHSEPAKALTAAMGDVDVVDEDAATEEAETAAARLASLSAMAVEQLQSSAAAVTASASTGYPLAAETPIETLLDVVLPGHFALPLPAADRARMLETAAAAGAAITHNNTKQRRQQQASDQHVTPATSALQAATDALDAVAARGRARLEAAAALRAQEARVYERTGSRFFQLPHCPDEPAYPPEVPILELIGNWNPDDVAVPKRHHSTLCRIDYQADHAKALRYRDAEVPFVLYNVPEFDETVRKWAQPNYLLQRLGPVTKRYNCEISTNNHFLYSAWNTKQREAYARSQGVDLPVEMTEWPYARWLDMAKRGETLSSSPQARRGRAHYYFKVSSGESPVIEEDLAIFTNANGSTLFMPTPDGNSTINCRFGMRGVVAEAHFDARRNMVAVVSGTRRWVLAHPRFCKNMHPFLKGHASHRQSQIDWARPDLEKYPDFAELKATEVILSAGEILYIPIYWLHYVSVLDVSAQCNCHNGLSEANVEHIAACGFPDISK